MPRPVGALLLNGVGPELGCCATRWELGLLPNTKLVMSMHPGLLHWTNHFARSARNNSVRCYNRRWLPGQQTGRGAEGEAWASSREGTRATSCNESKLLHAKFKGKSDTIRAAVYATGAGINDPGVCHELLNSSGRR